jgi:hypothetical protein
MSPSSASRSTLTIFIFSDMKANVLLNEASACQILLTALFNSIYPFPRSNSSIRAWARRIALFALVSVGSV